MTWTLLISPIVLHVQQLTFSLDPMYWDLVTGESRRGTSRPVAIKTVFGWVLSGPVKCGPPDESSTCLVTHILRVDGLSQNMQVLDEGVLGA